MRARMQRRRANVSHSEESSLSCRLSVRRCGGSAGAAGLVWRRVDGERSSIPTTWATTRYSEACVGRSAAPGIVSQLYSRRFIALKQARTRQLVEEVENEDELVLLDGR